MNTISWFLLPCCFLIVKSIPTSDVTLVLQKLRYDDTAYNMTWVLTGENLNSGIAWIQSIDGEETKTYESKYVPDLYKKNRCKINSKSNCSKFWIRNNWQIQNSHAINLDVVTDKRWEDFNEIYADGKTPFNFVQTFSNAIENKFTINFSIRVKRIREGQANIFLCDKKDPSDMANCYWILLDRFRGEKVIIRKCNNQIDANLYRNPREPCETPQQEKLIKADEILSVNEWKHFTISINKNNIVMKSVSNNVTLIDWFDDRKNYININHLLVRSYQQPAYWKFNTYEFTYTTDSSVDERSEPIGERMINMDNKLCFSFYAAMCAQCSLIISGIHTKDSAKADIFKETIHPLKEYAWQEVKLNISFPAKQLDIQLYEERRCSNNCQEQFWAIDDFRLCTDNEVRVLNVHGNPLKSSFQILVSPSRNMNLKPSITATRDVVQWPPLISHTDPSPPYYTIGSTNTNCNLIFGDGKQYCQESIICDYSNNEESICRCSPGYTGENCREPPFAVQFLEIISSNATSLTVSWKQPMNLNGKLKHYRINLKHHRYLACNENDNIQNIETFRQFQHQSTNITLNNLIPFSQYNIEIAVVTVEVGEFSSIMGETEETNTPDEFEIPTQVNVKPFSTTAQITLKQANCSLMKGNIEYYITTRCESEWCKNRTTTSNVTYYFAQQYFNITGLLPNSMYTMEIKVGRRNGNLYNGELLSTKFDTHPAAPNAAEFVIYEESRDFLRLRITPPYPPTGELEQYFIKYCQANACRSQIYNCNEKYFDAVTCKIWPKYHCLDISENVAGNIWYRIYVQARNKNITDLGPETHECEKTAQRTSYPPTILNATWDDYYNLTLQWNHPSITNGPLTKFGITILKMNNECNRSNYMVSEETTRLTYKSVVSINNQDCYTSKLTVVIQSFNEKAGSTATLQIDSPPEAPTLNTYYVESVSNTTITIALSAKKLQPPGRFSKSYMYIVLSESKSKFEIGNFDDALYNLENLKTLLHAWLIAKYNLTREIPLERNLTIGSNNSNHLLQSDVRSREIKLTPNTSYTITILMYNEYQDIKRYRVYEIVKSTSGSSIIIFTNHSSGNSSSIALSSIIILVVLLLLFWICYRKRKSGRWCSIFGNRHDISLPKDLNVIPLTQSLEIPATKIIKPDAQISPNKTMNNLKNKINVNISNSKFSKVISVTNFDIYVKEAIINGELERQHLSSLGVETKLLNSGYMIPNDYTDVIEDIQTENEYEEIDHDEYSENIDANYIEGYVSKCAYIATKIPQVAAVNNFWKLIWQDNVKYIVLLSRFTEEKEKNHVQYWPKIKETTQFENILVKCISIEIFADYEHRIFLLSSNKVEKEVQQLHFTSWTYHGVPMYPQSLVPLLKILLKIPESNSPIVIHCSVGMQAIGTVILCDLCLKMAAHNGVLDIIKYQRKIKAQKANLIGNFEQYKFVHLALLECLKTPDTNIICDNEAKNNILSLLETNSLENQFRFIGEVAWQDQAMRPKLQVNDEPAWKEKNRFQTIKANGHGRVYLSPYPKTDQHSNYINAVEVDGFKAPSRFIVTQQPLPNTIADFWRMIDEKEVSTIVSLNTINKENDRSCIFWPTFAINEIRPLPYLMIKFINKISKGEVAIINLELHSYKNKVHEKRDIYFIKLRNWPTNQIIPNSNESLLKLWCEVKEFSQTKYPIVVTCYDGATACGLFTAIAFVIDRIKLEHQCDICLAVRTVRRNREQFVSKLDQFKHLYNVTVEYLAGLELYANAPTFQEF